MEHLHAPAGVECVTIALEQIELVRLAGRTRRIRRLTGNLRQDTSKPDKRWPYTRNIGIGPRFTQY